MANLLKRLTIIPIILILCIGLIGWYALDDSDIAFIAASFKWFLVGAMSLLLMAGVLSLIVLVAYFRATIRKMSYIAPNDNGDFGIIWHRGEPLNLNLPLPNASREQLAAHGIWRVTTGHFGSVPATLFNQPQQLGSGGDDIIDITPDKFRVFESVAGSKVLKAIGQEEL